MRDLSTKHERDREMGQKTERQLVPIERSAGMLNAWSDVCWQYGRKRSQRYSWTRQMANGLSLSHPSNEGFWTLARRYQAALRNEMIPGKFNALTTIFAKTHVVLAVCDLAIRKGLSSLSAFDDVHYQEILTDFRQGRTGFSDKRVTKGRLEVVTSVFTDLHEFFAYPMEDGRFILNDGIRFSMFLSEDDRTAVAKAGNASGQTDDLPEEVVFAHIAAAMEYIGYYADDILELDRRRKEIKAKPEAEPSRARSGEAAAKVASLLREAVVDGSRPELLAGNRVNKRILAELSGVHHTSLYKKQFVDLSEPVEHYLSHPDGAARHRMLTVLDAPVLLFAEVSQKPPSRRAPTVQVGLPFTGLDGEFAPWPLTRLGAGAAGGGESLEAARSDLWSACYMMVLAYLAVRLDEGLSIRTDCIVPKIDGPYLRYRVMKNMNGEGGSLVERPVPDIVVKAVSVALRLGEDARRELKSDELFIVDHRSGASTLDSSTVRTRLASFGTRTGASRRVPRTDDEDWYVTPNHLRRFFVTMWVNYYAYARKYESLRWFLSHAWITTTVRYGLRREDLPRLTEQQREMTTKVLARKFFDGAGSLSEIPKFLVAFAEGLRIRALPAEQIFKHVRDFVEEQKVTLFAMPWGYCVWSDTAGKYAQCFEKSLRSLNLERGEAERTCEGCDGCQNLMRDEVFEPFYETGIERHAKIVANPDAPLSLVASAKAFIQIATCFLKRAA